MLHGQCYNVTSGIKHKFNTIDLLKIQILTDNCHQLRPGKDVGTQDTADDVAEMWHIVDVRQGTCDEQVTFASQWQPGLIAFGVK